MADITGHTPGPWTVDHERIGPWGEPVALLCDSHAPESGTIVEWPRFGEVVDDSGNIANARLIASAPTLLEALEIARSWLADANQPDFCPACEADNPGHDMVCPIPIIEEAIAKARGGDTTKICT